MGSLRAELLLLRKRAATWILLAVAVLMSVMFAYVLPYSSLGDEGGGPQLVDLELLLPESFVANMLEGFPFFMGTLVLILGVLVMGSEFGWDTLRTTLTQQPSRRRVLVAKLAALGVAVTILTVALMVIAAIASTIVALLEDEAIDWPGASEIARGLGAGWLILTAWALFGVLLAMLSRGTALAIGLGILWGLVIEGVVAGFGGDVAVLEDLSLAFLRTNGYSLVEPLGVTLEGAQGPGEFSGPFVGAWQALLVFVGYLVVFGAVSLLLLNKRDVS